MKKWILLFLAFLFVPGNASASALQFSDNNSYMIYHSTYPEVRQLSENNNEAEIQYWKHELVNAEHDLDAAVKENNWNIIHKYRTTNSAENVRLCEKRVEICKKHLRDIGYSN